MSLIGLLEVGIGIIFTYLVLSLICSATTEIFEAFLKRRASTLYAGIVELLGNNNDNAKVDVQKLYDHPLIRALYKGSFSEAKEKRGLPSYIPARNFALALMDLVLPAGATNEELSGAAGAVSTPAQPQAAPQVVVYPAAARITRMHPGTASTPNPLQPLRDAVSTIQNNDVQRALLPLIDAAGDDVNRARENIERWFDSSMDRVSGWYKRRTQWWLFGIGLVVTLTINADTIAIGESLANDSALRSSLVAAAQTYVATNPAPGTPPLPDSTSEFSSCQQDANSPACRIDKSTKRLEELGLPIGWDNPRSLPSSAEWGAWVPLAWLLKLLGWLMTAVALTLGAPFWFDLLNKFLVVRSTVKPTEKSPEEKSED